MMSWLPENVSTYGGSIDSLFYLIYYICGVVFVLVHVLLLAFIVLYRGRPGRKAVYMHGNTTLEVVWTLIPAVIVLLLAVIAKPAWDHVKRELPPSEHVVRVTAKQFNWEFLYPGPDGKFETEDDVTMDNELHVPVNSVVQLALRSRDVIHSFFVPVFRLKQDTMPGREIMAWFEATETGRWEIPCAELCGFGHSGMKGSVTVHSPEEYDAWVQQQWASGAEDEAKPDDAGTAAAASAASAG